MVAGKALSSTTAGDPATNITVALSLKPPTVAVTVAVPRPVAAVRLTMATPLAFVRAVVDNRRPTVVVKVTTRPAGEKPDAVVTVARMATVLFPSATTLGALATAVMDVTCDKFCDSVTVIEANPTTVLVTCACTVSAPGMPPAVYFTVACPLLLVTPLTALRVAPLVLVDSEKVTVSPAD